MLHSLHVLYCRCEWDQEEWQEVTTFTSNSHIIARTYTLHKLTHNVHYEVQIMKVLRGSQSLYHSSILCLQLHVGLVELCLVLLSSGRGRGVGQS